MILLARLDPFLKSLFFRGLDLAFVFPFLRSNREVFEIGPLDLLLYKTSNTCNILVAELLVFSEGSNFDPLIASKLYYSVPLCVVGWLDSEGR